MGKFKRAVETILVASGNATVVADGSTTLVSSTGACNLASGQLGVFHGSYDGGGTVGTAISVGDTVTDAPAIVIAQGTANASSPGPASFEGFYNITHLQSAPIFGKMTKVYRGQSYVAPRMNAWMIGAIEGSADAIGTPLDETTYSFRVTFRSARHEETYSNATRDSILVSYTTPDYTTLGTTNPLDDLVQNLVHEANKNSRAVVTDGRRGNKPFVAFAVRHDQASHAFSAGGTVLVSALDALAGGVAYPTYYGFSTDAETTTSGANSAQGAAWVALAADANSDLATTDAVCPVNLTTAGTNTYGANGIVIMALDALPAYDDRVPQLKVDMEVSTIEGFTSSVGVYDSSAMQEPEGDARKMRIMFRNTMGQRIYSQNRSGIPIIELIDPDVNIATGEIYDTYIIEHEQPHYEKSYFDDNARIQRTYIFVPTDNTTTTAALEAVLNPYFASVDFPAVAL